MRKTRLAAGWLFAACLVLFTAAGCRSAETARPAEAVFVRSTPFPDLPTPLPSTATVTPAPSATGTAGARQTPTARPGARFDLPGQILYVKDDQIYLWWRGESTRQTVDARNTDPSWLPDGQSFLFTRWSQGFSDLYRYYVSGRPVEQLTQNDPVYGGRGAWATQPAVAPNGRTAAYISDRDTAVPALWTIDLTNRSARRIAPDPNGLGGVQDPSWKADGSALAAVSAESNKSQVWTLPLTTTVWARVTQSADGAYAPAWHPSGEWIAYTERRGASHDIWISRPDGRNATRLTTDGASRSPVWALDGSVLILASRRDNVFDLFAGRVEFTGGQPRLGLLQQLTKGSNLDPGGGLSWNPRDS